MRYCFCVEIVRVFSTYSVAAGTVCRRDSFGTADLRNDAIIVFGKNIVVGWFFRGVLSSSDVRSLCHNSFVVSENSYSVEPVVSCSGAVFVENDYIIRLFSAQEFQL